MRLIQGKDYDEMSRKAAKVIAAQVTLKPNCVLGLATGSSPLGTYKNLIEEYEKGDLDFSQVSSVNLDEYKGLAPDNDQSYRYFMKHNFFDHVNIDQSRTYVPNGLEADSEKACKAHDDIICELGGIDLQLLGLGLNGHIGFNEPAADFPTGTHCVDLTESTIQANSRFFASADEVPTQAYTMGIQSIMMAKRIVIIVSGEQKAEIVAKAFAGPVTPEVPASILQMHPDVTLVTDEAAASLLVKALAEKNA